MIKQLTPVVWWGDKTAPFECVGQVGAIICVAHGLRRDYFAGLKWIPYSSWYFRLGLKDREDIDSNYAAALEAIVKSCAAAGKLPILTHCRMGMHRGPTAAVFAAWVLAGKTSQALTSIHDSMIGLYPGLLRGKNYYLSTMAYMRSHCSDGCAATSFPA